MHFFLDTSALIKLFHEELGSTLVTALMDEPGREAVISRLAVVEFGSVMALKVRTGALKADEADLLLDQLYESVETGEFMIESLLDEDFEQALRLINHYGRQRSLKILDALHLALALRLSRSSPLDTFVTGDRALASVARATGLKLIFPE